MNNEDLEWLVAQQPAQMGADDSSRERARRALIQHTSVRSRKRGFAFGGSRRRRTFGVAVATGLAGAAVVVAVSAAGNGATRAQPRQQPRASQVTAAHHSAKHSPLVRLADYVSGSATPAGDATVVARTTTTGGQSVTVYDLYADNGKYFFSTSEAGLAGQVSAGHNLAGGLFAREIAAAKLAATGNVQTAAQEMADAPDPSHVVSRTQKKLTKAQVAAAAAKLAMTHQPKAALRPDLKGSDFDNYTWENSQDALIAGSGQPAVRAGVLRIFATLPGVTVTNGTYDGQSTLVLTAGAFELGYDYIEQLTINADTGVPIQFVGGPPHGTPATTVDYTVSRVTLATLSASTGNTE